MREVWLPFPDAELRNWYSVSNYGRVIDDNGYEVPWRYKVTSSSYGKEIAGPRVRLASRLSFSVPLIVLLAFSDEDKDGRWALHRNDNRLDNRYPINLYWGDRLDNGRDRSVTTIRKRSVCQCPVELQPLIPFAFIVNL